MANYTPERKRAWYAQRRAQGLCVNCPMPSKFWRCSFCRLEQSAMNNRSHLASYYRHRDAINARRRARYQELKAA